MSAMQEVSFQEIRNQIIDAFRTLDIFPILGAGFTMNCKTEFNRHVPSGKECAEQMLELICKTNELDQESMEELKGSDLKDISEIFYEVVPGSKRLEYFTKYFSKVKLGKNKRKILNIPWNYIYTLNIDDGIEKNSEFKKVITVTNRAIRDEVFNEKKCVIKLHGDIDDYMTYKDGTGLVFSMPQYIKILSDNEPLLNRLSHDIRYKNIIYIGCSLDGELDLLQTTTSTPEKDMKNTNRYYFTANELSSLQKIRLKKYQITHIVKFNNFDEIYEEMESAWNESCKISVDDLTLRGKMKFQISDVDTYESNKDYLFYGNSAIQKMSDGWITSLPYYFIEREITDDVIEKLRNDALVILRGNACSGKTYILYDIARRIKNFNVLLFQTKERLSDTAFDTLMAYQDSIFLFDELSLSRDQINYIFKHVDFFEKRGLHFLIVFGTKTNIISINLDMMLDNSVFAKKDVFFVSSRFTANEMRKINNKLLICGLGIFENKSILDNIISLGEQLQEEYKYQSILPVHETIKDLAVLIVLALQEKIYSYQGVQFDLLSEIASQEKAAYPLIEEQITFGFERDAKDNSNHKYVLNAEYWLRKWLSRFAKEERYSLISQAFSYIMGKILKYNGDVTIDKTDNKLYREYIWFDNINAIFNVFNDNRILLIKLIYDDLRPILSMEPSYNHQKAKAYIRCAYYSLKKQNAAQAESYLKEALRFVIGAVGIYQKRFNDTENEYVKISLDHAVYTHAIILCHLLKLHSYSNLCEIQSALDVLYEAFSSPHNSYSYAKKDRINFDNVLIETINYLSSNNEELDSTHKSYLEYLVNTSWRDMKESVY